MKNKRFFIGLLLSFILVMGQIQGVFAEEEDLEQKLENLQNEAYQQQLKIEKAQEKVDTVSEQLRRIQEEVNAAESEYKRVKKVLDATDAKILENKEIILLTEQKLEIKSRLLRRRIRDIYMHGQVNYLDVLLGAKTFSDFITRMDLLKRVIKYDYDLLQQILKERSVLVVAQEELKKARREQEMLVGEADKQLDLLMTKKADKDRLLEKVKYDRDTSEQAYQEILAASREIEALIKRRGQPGGDRTVIGNGSMIWPLYGEVTSEYGWRYHPIYGDSRYHSGIDIGGEYGDVIVAAASGTCIYSDWISGYGYTIIIEHGGGIETLYGHNEELLVHEGQSVAQGQAIALCGSTGNSTGPHCHFEVREDGEAVSPYNYL